MARRPPTLTILHLSSVSLQNISQLRPLRSCQHIHFTRHDTFGKTGYLSSQKCISYPLRKNKLPIGE